MRDVAELADAVDLAIGRADGILDSDILSGLSARARALRARRGFLGESLVMAVAGGTGSGKSSLVNAIAGAPVSSVSHLRPHTDEPMAWIPERAEQGLRLLIDDLGIRRRIEQDVLPGIALVDLPDLDSIAEWHRRTVEEILPRVDGVLWLFDPEKYSDRVIHEEFLRPLAAYRDQFLFVLNKVDRLPGNDTRAVVNDLAGRLVGDGFPEPVLFPTAALPETGEQEGVAALVDHLLHEVDVKRLATAKLITDAEHLLRELGMRAGVWRGGEIGFPERWRRVRDHAAATLGRGADHSAREDALCHLEDLVAAVAVEVGAGYGDTVRGLLPRDRIEAVVEAAAVAAGTSEPVRRRRGRKAPAPVSEAAIALLQEELGFPLRRLVWDRSRFGATVAYAAVGARQLRARLEGAEPGSGARPGQE
ncbi:MAG: GTPase [Acidimicrobiia bacterium]